MPYQEFDPDTGDYKEINSDFLKESKYDGGPDKITWLAPIIFIVLAIAAIYILT